MDPFANEVIKIILYDFSTQKPTREKEDEKGNRYDRDQFDV